MNHIPASSSACVLTGSAFLQAASGKSKHTKAESKTHGVWQDHEEMREDIPFIVAVLNASGTDVCRDGQLVELDFVKAFDTEDPGNLPDIRNDALQVLAVGNFQSQIDTGVQIVRVASQRSNVRAGFTDYTGDVR